MDSQKNYVISYLTIRQLIGVLGILLPIVLIVGGYLQRDNSHLLQESISNYYYTNMRDYFVGLLCSVAMFLISYKGYESIDNIIANISGLSALGIVIFPTFQEPPNTREVGIFLIDETTSGKIHLLFAFLFFISLAYYSLFIFTKTGAQPETTEKINRNRMYRLCGYIILFSILSIFLYYHYFQEDWQPSFYPVLFFESIALFAFGLSWLIKGETLLKDKSSSL